MANIEDFNEPWNGHSGLEVETFLKGQLGAMSAALDGKFGYVSFNPNTMSLLFYDKQGGTVIGDITLGGEVITIDLHCNLPQSFYILADESSKVMTLTPTTSKSQFGSSSSENVPELYTYTILVDTGSGYVPRASGETRQVGETISVNLKPFLLTGDNYIRVSVTGQTTGKTQTTVFTGTMTSLFLSCSHSWQNVWQEGSDYVLNGIRFAGSLVKYLHVSVKKGLIETELPIVEYGANVSYVNTTTTFTIPASAFPITGETSDICVVNLWMTAQGVSTPIVSFNIMCAKAGDTTPLVAVNSVVETAFNFTSGRLFSFAVHNADTAAFTLSATLGSSTYPIAQALPQSGLSAGVQYPFTYNLEVDTGANNTRLGTMAISAKASSGAGDGPVATASAIFDNSYSYLATPGYLFYLNAATRSNNAEDHLSIVNEGTPDSHFETIYPAVWTGFSFSDDGWAMDDLGYKALVVPAGAELTVTDLRPLASFSAYTGGMTIELMLKTRMPADYATPVLTIGTTSAGLLIYPTKIVVFGTMEGNETSQSVVFAENTMTHLVVTFIKNYGNTPGRNLCSIYVNGISNVNFPFSGLSSYGEGSLVIGQENTDVYLYKMRIYGTPLEPEAVLSNFLNSIVDGLEFRRSDVVAKNTITDNGTIAYNLCKRAGYNTMVITLPSDSSPLPDVDHQAKDGDGTAISNAKFEFEYADDPTKNATVGKLKLDGQGTTSMKYYRWNLRGKTSDKAGKETTWEYGDGTTGAPGKKGRMINDPNYVMVDRITAKKNYASSMQGHKMGLTGLYNDIFHKAPLSLGAHLPNQSYLVAVYQFPFVGFRKYSNGLYEFIGLYTAGPDKSSKTSFGHSTSKFPNLMSIEGPNHDPRGTRFLHPWVDVTYDQDQETLCIGGDEAWDCAIAGDNETSNEGSQGDWDNILALYESEWRPAYECVFNNSPYIARLSDALTESGFASIDAVNANENTIKAFQDMTTGGVSNELLTFYDENYDIWFYRTQEKKYRKLSAISSDPRLETNVKTALATYLSQYCADPATPTTAEIIAMRSARFRAYAPDYFDMDQTLYHYCYCIMFGVTDNFAKNSYPFKFRGFNETLGEGENVYCKRWGWRQDDVDTSLATDNNGRNTKSYSVEHGDLNPSGKQIYNGGDSALWMLIRDNYKTEQKEMMGRMVQAMGNIASDLGVTGDSLHETVLNVVSYYCWDRTSKYFSQTLYENDRSWSYITPWLADPSKKYNDVFPWEQALGDQLQAEKMWVQRRIAYIFSKYRIGAFTGTDTNYNGLAITLASSYVFRITPAIDLYPVGSTGSTDSQGQRTRAGQTSSLPVAAGSGTTNNYIHGLDWIASLGDLADMVLTDRGGDTNIVFSVKSARLQRLKVGDEDSTKVSFNATGLAVESPSITEIDARNTRTLKGELSLFNCPRLKVCLFEGSGITGLLLPVGALLTRVSFPSAASTVFMHSLPLLTNENLTLPPLGGIITLYINNCDQLSPFAIAASILAVSGNKLTNVTLLWNGIIATEVNTILGLAALNGRVKYENGLVVTEEGKPNIEGMAQIPGLYADDLDRLAIETEEDYQTGLKKALSGIFGTAFYIVYDPATLWIRFADDAVKEVCVAHWDSNEDGELSTQEATAVTSLSTYFMNNTAITEFDELRYFTNLTAIYGSNTSSSAFRGCSALKKVTIPENVTAIQPSAFYQCYGLEELTIKGKSKDLSVGVRAFQSTNKLARVNLDDIERWCRMSWDATGVFNYSGSGTRTVRLYKDNVEITSVEWPSILTTISGHQFFNCVGLQSINIPQSVTYIGNNAFAGCSSLRFPGDLYLPNTSIPRSCEIYSHGTSAGTITCGSLNVDDSSGATTCAFGKIVVTHNVTFYRWHFVGANLKEVRIGGNVYCSSTASRPSGYGIFGGTSSSNGVKLSFLEVGGVDSYPDRQPTNTWFYGSYSNCAILHLANTAVACAPSRVPISKVTGTVYVGPGESQEGDEAVLELYRQDENWAPYVESGKVKTWWSYEGEFKY